MRWRLIIVVVMLTASSAGAKDLGHGKVNMKGEIVASACRLSSDTLDQSIDLGSLPINTIIRDGHGPNRNFTIRLEDCEPLRPGFWDFKSVRLTFDGPRDEVPHLLRIRGEATGVGILLKDSEGKTIIPGEALTGHPLRMGNIDLNYSLAIQKNNDVLKAGYYQSTVRFKVEYY